MDPISTLVNSINTTAAAGPVLEAGSLANFPSQSFLLPPNAIAGFVSNQHANFNSMQNFQPELSSQLMNTMETPATGSSSSSNNVNSNTKSNRTKTTNNKSRSIEEDHCVILERSKTTSAKSSNSRYRCRYCDFEFVGGPQKIRVHLTGKRENGTRLSKCEKVPLDVRQLMESRMKPLQDPKKAQGIYEDPEPLVQGLHPRNLEEQHCIVLERSTNPLAKCSNSVYKCIYCRFKFVGGPQKIRVHLTGQVEGGTRIAKCMNAPPEVIMMMECRRKGPKPPRNDTVINNVPPIPQPNNIIQSIMAQYQSMLPPYYTMSMSPMGIPMFHAQPMINIDWSQFQQK